MPKNFEMEWSDDDIVRNKSDEKIRLNLKQKQKSNFHGLTVILMRTLHRMECKI